MAHTPDSADSVEKVASLGQERAAIQAPLVSAAPSAASVDTADHQEQLVPVAVAARQDSAGPFPATVASAEHPAKQAQMERPALLDDQDGPVIAEDRAVLATPATAAGADIPATLEVRERLAPLGSVVPIPDTAVSAGPAYQGSPASLVSVAPSADLAGLAGSVVGLADSVDSAVLAEEAAGPADIVASVVEAEASVLLPECLATAAMGMSSF